MCINFTAAYDTVWHRALAYKLLRHLPDRHMVKMMIELFYIAALSLPTVVEGKAGSDYSKMASLRVMF